MTTLGAGYVMAGVSCRDDRLINDSDLAAAVDALQRLGVRGGVVIVRARPALAPLVARAWSELGVDPVLAPVDVPDGLLDRLRSRDDVAGVFIEGTAPPEAMLSEVAGEAFSWIADAAPGVVEGGPRRIGFLTSGTTGRPKIAFRTLESLTHEADIVRRTLQTARLWASGGILVTASLSHVYAHVLGWTAAQSAGALMVCAAGTPSGRRLQEIATTYSASVLIGVPAQYERWSAWRADLPEAILGTCISAGSRLGPKTIEKFRGSWGRIVVNHYGTTETGSIAYDLEGAGGNDVGKPYPGLEIRRIADRTVAVHTPWGAGGPESDDSYVLDDSISISASGRLKVHGRRSDDVNVHGVLVSLIRVTEVLLSFDGVQDAHVRAVQTPDADNYLVAYLVCKDADVATLAVWCKNHLRSHEIPRRWVRMDTIPRDQNGKVAARALDQEADR